MFTVAVISWLNWLSFLLVGDGAQTWGNVLTIFLCNGHLPDHLNNLNHLNKRYSIQINIALDPIELVIHRRKTQQIKQIFPVSSFFSSLFSDHIWFWILVEDGSLSMQMSLWQMGECLFLTWFFPPVNNLIDRSSYSLERSLINGQVYKRHTFTFV